MFSTWEIIDRVREKKGMMQRIIHFSFTNPFNNAPLMCRQVRLPDTFDFCID